MRLINADELLKVINDSEELRYAVLHAEPHDCVSRKLFEQIKAERDIAVSQLRELNIELGERVDLKAIPIEYIIAWKQTHDLAKVEELLIKYIIDDWRKDNEIN